MYDIKTKITNIRTGTRIDLDSEFSLTTSTWGSFMSSVPLKLMKRNKSSKDFTNVTIVLVRFLFSSSYSCLTWLKISADLFLSKFCSTMAADKIFTVFWRHAFMVVLFNRAASYRNTFFGSPSYNNLLWLTGNSFGGGLTTLPACGAMLSRWSVALTKR